MSPIMLVILTALATVLVPAFIAWFQALPVEARVNALSAWQALLTLVSLYFLFERRDRKDP
jgi:hypothetical protein